MKFVLCIVSPWASQDHLCAGGCGGLGDGDEPALAGVPRAAAGSVVVRVGGAADGDGHDGGGAVDHDGAGAAGSRGSEAGDSGFLDV